MNNFKHNPFQELAIYLFIGIFIYFVLFIINQYIIPVAEQRKKGVSFLWQKAKIVVWLVFSILILMELFIKDLYFTLFLSILVFGLGWSFWQDLYVGIILKFNNKYKIGDSITYDKATGIIEEMNWTNIKLLHNKNERIIIPNYKFRNSVFIHQDQSQNKHTYSFTVELPKGETVGYLKEMALNCPYISANQKIDISQKSNELYQIEVSVIDDTFIADVRQYFHDLIEK